MSDRWQEMAVFVRVAEGGGLSRAARELNLSQPSVSRIIGALEARLGTTLLLRTTRSISLTEAGSLYLERARHLLAEMEEAEQATRGLDSLHGVLRLAMPVLYGARAVIPALATFLPLHPDLRVEIVMSDARQNLVTEGVDVAIRLGVGPLDDSTFGARRIARVERLVVAVAGLAVALATRVMAGEELRSGQLVQLLDRYRLEPAEVYAVFPAGPRPSAKVRAIVDHLAASLDASG